MIGENEINQLAEKIINFFDNQEKKKKKDDTFSYMVASFYYKQRYHLENLFKLNDSHDLELICRCMIEGMAVLYHAKNDSKFVSRWMEQGDIEDLKILHDKEKNGTHVDKEQKHYIRQRVDKLDHLLKSKAKNDIQNKKRNSNYNDYELHKIPMKTFVRELSEKAAYWNDIYAVYDRFSKWQHWNPAGISQFAKLSDNDLSFFENYNMRTTVLIYGIFCLLQTSRIFDQVFVLNQEQELNILEEDMMKIFIKISENNQI